MSDQIDQFGRDKSKPLSDNISDDKSKKILESLAEIKNQLENKNYTPKVETNNNTLNRDTKSIRTKNLDFEQLQQRIEFLEEKLITLANKVPSEHNNTKLDIEENIEIGLMTRDVSSDTKDWVLGLFPHLQERLHQAAGTLSGGEQQMLATARALALRPKVLMLDEPTEGLQPSMSEQIRQVIINMKSEGFAIILVEQRIDAVLSVADRITMIENGKSVETLTATELKNAPETVKRYLGV